MGSSQTKQPTWSAVKAEITGLEARQLVNLIADLYRLSKENQAFLQARFAVAADPLAHVKQIIEACVAPDVLRNKPIQIAKAKKAISDFCKAVNDPAGEAELMIFFVEQGNAFTIEYGDIDESFYAALVLMFGRAVDKVCSLPAETGKPFQARLNAIIDAASPIGWGYPDALRDHFSRFSASAAAPRSLRRDGPMTR